MGRIKSDISGKKRYPNLPSQSNLQHAQQLNHNCGCFNPSGAGFSASSPAQHGPPGAVLRALHPPHSKPDWTQHRKIPPLSSLICCKAGSSKSVYQCAPIPTEGPKVPTEHCCEVEVQTQIPSDKVCHRLKKINN